MDEFLSFVEDKKSKMPEELYLSIINKVKENYRIYNSLGELRAEIWLKNGVLHREDGPAVLDYMCYGVQILMGEYWYNNGNLYRGNREPAVIKYYHDGTLYLKGWCNEKGVCHEVVYGPSGKILVELLY